MATYTVTGHPLNYNDMGLTGIQAETLRAQLHLVGVGQSITITLAGPDDTKVKGHGTLR